MQSMRNEPVVAVGRSQVWLRWFKAVPYAIMLLDAAFFEKHFYPLQLADFYSLLIALVVALAILVPVSLRFGMEKRFLKRALGLYLFNFGFALLLELAFILKFKSLYVF